MKKRNLVVLLSNHEERSIEEFNELRDKVPPVSIHQPQRGGRGVGFVEILTQQIELRVEKGAGEELPHHPHGEQHRPKVVQDQNFPDLQRGPLLHDAGTDGDHDQVRNGCTNHHGGVTDEGESVAPHISRCFKTLPLVHHALENHF